MTGLRRREQRTDEVAAFLLLWRRRKNQQGGPVFFFFLTRVNHDAAPLTQNHSSGDGSLLLQPRLRAGGHISKSSGSVITFGPRLGVWASVPASPPDERTVWGRRSNLNSADTAARLFSRRLCLVSSGGLGIVRAVKSLRATSTQWGRIPKSPESSVALQVYTCISKFFWF